MSQLDSIHPQKMDVQKLVADLTRTESGKLISVLTRIFGAHNLAMAEDVVQDVLMKALENWSDKGVPDNPPAWLFRVAKNKAIDIIRKYRRERTFASDISSLLNSEYTTAITLNDCFKDEEVRDDQLRMMFACCHPSISGESQIALILKTLSGFTVAQIAKAFITSADTIEKRLYRARQAFRENNISLEIPTGQSLQKRLDNILETIYLLFNEAYSSSYHDSLVREDLAADCIRLCTLLTAHPATNTPRTDALLALLYFHASRFSGRVNVNGELLLMKQQNRSLWDKEMIEMGIFYLGRASHGVKISRYHLEAAIAYEHCKAAKYEDTDWKAIMDYYNLLIQLVPSPVILLNRAIAIKELEGPAKALQSIKEIPGIGYLQQYYLLHAILGELYSEMKDVKTALAHYEKSLNLCVSVTEKKLIQQNIDKLKKESGS